MSRIFNKTQNFREKHGDIKYQNSTLGIKMIYPPNWDVEDTCIKKCYEEFCSLGLVSADNLKLRIISTPPNMYTYFCSCNDIRSYIKEEWNQMYVKDNIFVDEFIFITDNTTSINGFSTIMLEFKEKIRK